MANFPSELKMSEAEMAQGIESDDLVKRRLSVQSLCLQAGYHQVRLTLHRHYVSCPANATRTGPHAASTDIAISSAEELINLATLAGAHVANEGHFMWFAFYLFTAGMLFSFQLISGPDQPAAAQFRRNVERALSALNRAPERVFGVLGVAKKSYQILFALSPLYSDNFRRKPLTEQKAEKAAVFSMVRTLAFPFYGQQGRDRASETDVLDSRSSRQAMPPSSRASFTPARDHSMSTASPVSQDVHMIPTSASHPNGRSMLHRPLQIDTTGAPRALEPSWGYVNPGYPIQSSQSLDQHATASPAWPPQTNTQYHAYPRPFTETSVSVPMSYSQDAYRHGGSGVEASMQASGTTAAGGTQPWAAAIGFGRAEWEFMHTMQPPDFNAHTQ
jgi:hypothetical protein